MSEVTDQCVTCKKAVDESQEAMGCDFCNQWEHVGCVRKRERPSQALYNALIECHTKTLMCVCTCCRRHGPVSQRLFQYEKELARVNDERLASAQQRAGHVNWIATQGERGIASTAKCVAVRHGEALATNDGPAIGAQGGCPGETRGEYGLWRRGQSFE